MCQRVQIKITPPRVLVYIAYKSKRAIGAQSTWLPPGAFPCMPITIGLMGSDTTGALHTCMLLALTCLVGRQHLPKSCSFAFPVHEPCGCDWSWRL